MCLLSPRQDEQTRLFSSHRTPRVTRCFTTFICPNASVSHKNTTENKNNAHRTHPHHPFHPPHDTLHLCLPPRTSLTTLLLPLAVTSCFSDNFLLLARSNSGCLCARCVDGHVPRTLAFCHRDVNQMDFFPKHANTRAHARTHAHIHAHVHTHRHPT